MIWWRILLSLVGGYLLGSISVAIVLTRRKGGDVRDKGSGNAGATNVARVYGIWVGLATLVGDGVKTAVAMLVLGRLLAGDQGMVAAAFGCLLGHCFPLYFGFRGGKAVSVGAAIGLCLDWRLFLILLGVFLILAFSTKRVSVGSMAAAVAFPIGQLILGGFPWYSLALGCFITVFVIFMHRENVKRLLHGKEPEFKLGKTK
jgi:glycerol-3-phosphate acyltransferase PlsY